MSFAAVALISKLCATPRAWTRSKPRSNLGLVGGTLESIVGLRGLPVVVFVFDVQVSSLLRVCVCYGDGASVASP